MSRRIGESPPPDRTAPDAEWGEPGSATFFSLDRNGADC